MSRGLGDVYKRQTFAWGYDFDGDDRVVDTHIKRIRKALGEKAECIKTIINTGYSFREV